METITINRKQEERMSTNVARAEAGAWSGRVEAVPALRYAVPLGRALFVAIFMMSGFTHFSPDAVGYAAQAGVPFASFMVPASGIMAFVGGLSILLGYKARLGAWLLVLFLLPVTVMLHAFWAMDDPMAAGMHQALFMKNVSMLGAALVIASSTMR
jgi:putative oxidoreductase